ncbi:MAG: undecaprenyl-phosphate glucose phosphotransferase [Spongiibacteraceae bacterium]
MNSSVRLESLIPLTPERKIRPKRLLQDHDTLISHLQLAASIALSVSTLLLFSYLIEGEIETRYRYLAMVVAFAMASIYHWRGVHRRFNGVISGCMRLARSWLLMVGLTISMLVIMRLENEYSPEVLVAWAFFGFLSQACAYTAFYKISCYLKSRTQPVRRVLVVGSGTLAHQVISSINRNAWISDQVIGVVDECTDCANREVDFSVPMLGGFNEISNIVALHNIGRIYIALPICQSNSIEKIYTSLSDRTIDVVWIPDIFSMRLLNHSVKELNGLPLIMLSETPLASQSCATVKAAIDKVLAAIMLIALSPLMITVAILVALSSPGPIIFKQKRHGFDGRVIEIWKFRSMVVHQDSEVAQAKRDDARVTKIGKFIRRTSIDELPQLFNVLQGSMSLVGPRPHAIEHNQLYAQQIPAYMQRHRIKPGITGLAQVTGYRGETETLDKMLRRVELDIEYINNWSIWFDFVLLLKTPLSLFGRNVY